MPWEPQEVRVWAVCWKWGFIPYPCRKIVTKYCCTGNWRWRVLGAVARENYFCCDGKQSKWWDVTFFFGLPQWHLVQNVQKCRNSVPDQIDGCPDFVDEFPDLPEDVG